VAVTLIMLVVGILEALTHVTQTQGSFILTGMYRKIADYKDMSANQSGIPSSFPSPSLYSPLFRTDM
jgi:hypothetical protein